MLQADGSLGAEVAAEVGGPPGGGRSCSCGPGPHGGVQGARGHVTLLGPPQLRQRSCGEQNRRAGQAGLQLGPATSGSSPLAPGHVARGGAQAAPAPRGAGGAASFRALIVGQERLHPPVQGPRGA